MMTKELLKKLYAEYKKGADGNSLKSALSSLLEEALKDMGFIVSLSCGCMVYNTTRKKKKLSYNYITITVTRGKEQYFTQRVNAIIDFVFNENRNEADLFNIIYNRV